MLVVARLWQLLLAYHRCCLSGRRGAVFVTAAGAAETALAEFVAALAALEPALAEFGVALALDALAGEDEAALEFGTSLV